MAITGLFMFIGLIFFLVILVGVTLLVVWAVRSHPPSAAVQPPMGATPKDILDRRFAAGEIGADEYQRARDLLGGGGTKT